MEFTLELQRNEPEIRFNQHKSDIKISARGLPKNGIQLLRLYTGNGRALVAIPKSYFMVSPLFIYH